MSKKFKSQASSARAASAAFGSASFGFGAPPGGFQTATSSLSYVGEQPDLSGVSDPNIVVALRNLGKKDSTTKAKALEELQEHVASIASGDAIDSALLEAWINLYPRTSIDNARRVRQLAHTLQGNITALSGKRIAPHLSKVIGPWLSGTYDSDRSVARAAQESVAVSFPSAEKRKALWKVYKAALIEYAEDAILTQTSKTLSDERSTTPDDAEAKFVRVVGNAIYMFAQIIRTNSSSADGSQTDLSEAGTVMVQNKKLWEYSYHDDPTLRRAVYSLAVVCTDHLATHLDWTTISACFIAKALHTGQIGSSTQLSHALLVLTTARPEIWTTDYTSKTSATKRLLQYLRGGSRRGSVEFWTNIGLLLRKLPPQILSHTADKKVDLQDAASLIDALRTGVTSPEEPRQNLGTAWSVYVETSFWVLEMVEEGDSQSSILTKHVLPLVDQYLSPDPEQSSWNLPSSLGLKISGTILIQIVCHGLYSTLEEACLHFYQRLADGMKLSLPESSKEFAKSQDSMISHGQRLFSLRSFVLQATDLHAAERVKSAEIFHKSDEKLIDVVIDLLNVRHGKPYGAAYILEEMAAEEELLKLPPLQEFLKSEAPALLSSPSAEYLIVILLRTHQALHQLISKLISSEDSAYTVKALSRLLSKISDETLIQSDELQNFVLHRISTELEKDSTQIMTKALLQNENLQSSEFWKLCEQRILDRLSPDTTSISQQTTLQFLLSLFASPPSVSAMLSNDLASVLLSKLLVLSDSGTPETAELATSMISKLKTTSAGSDSATASSTGVISDQLSGTGTPLSIFALIDLAKDTLKTAPSHDARVVASLMPSAAQWDIALEHHIVGARPLELSITNSLHGTLFVVSRQNGHSAPDMVRDADEFSLLFRLVLYVTKILSESEIMALQSAEQLRALYYYFPLALQLVNEKLTVESANDIWHNTSEEVTEEAAEVLSQGTTLIQSWLGDELLIKIWIDAIRSSDDLSPRSYLHGQAFTEIASRYIDEHGFSLIASSFETEIKDMYRAPEVIRSASLCCTCRDQLLSSSSGRRLLNDLVAACTDTKAGQSSTPGLRPLVLLDLLLNGSSEPLDGIPTQRMVFLMQALLRLLDQFKDDLSIKVEALKLLDPILSATRDIYGDHWDQVLQCLVSEWQKDGGLDNDLPLLHASLRLYGRLRTLVGSDEINEDLAESWETAQASLKEGLLQCLKRLQDSGTGLNQPRRITAELLRRQLSHISVEYDPELYPLLSSTDNAIRGAAYDLLHRSIPAEQEQNSLELALNQQPVQLPVELISLISDTPSTTTPEAALRRQSYLLRWHLIFDHFTTASYKLQEQYTTDIRDKGVLTGLLNSICDICRITSGRPLDASKVGTETFELGGGDDADEQIEQRLSMHLYYCCLLYLPSLTRGWFLEQKNRVKSPLESWTQKYFTPSLTLAAVKTVTEWVATQPQDDSEAPVSVKTSLNGSEAVASIAVDPESPPISLTISLPSTYPLDPPTISSRTRVGVSEKNWQSWLRTFQIIIFSTGSIIEGLVAFRRNVQGALKGQSECAICYSIIGTDMQTPNKRCGTCRNTFHGVCLFRWFKSSNSSSCPLCRNNFNYA